MHLLQESIKASQGWFMACAAYAPGLAYMMAARAAALPDFEKLLHLVYLANDILFKAMQLQQGVLKLEEGQQPLDPATAASITAGFVPAVGVLLAAAHAAAQVCCRQSHVRGNDGPGVIDVLTCCLLTKTWVLPSLSSNTTKSIPRYPCGCAALCCSVTCCAVACPLLHRLWASHSLVCPDLRQP